MPPVAEPTLVQKYKSFGGWVEFYSHPSSSCPSTMKFSIYRPPQMATEPVPVLYWLSGLTCTEENFMIKSGVQSHAAEHGICIVAPDTSPRGAGIPGEEKDWDFGTGAGFYVNATQPKWKDYYRMYDYVTEELPALIGQHFSVRPDKQSISGHSMGGHGALISALRNPGKYASVSAFSPICAPTLCPWGEKALSQYLGSDIKDWASYDTNELIKQGAPKIPLLIDQGTDDSFLEAQLKPNILKETCAKADHPLELRFQDGYDHSYYFIASFIGEHIAYHAKHLKAPA